MIRLILDPPRSASLNMAVDEILMGSQKDPASVPVLRIYFWDKLSYSIGYFQNVAQVVKRFNCKKKKITVVRRITGGGMVQHNGDITFSLSLRNPNPYVPSETKSSYLKINEALWAGFRKSGSKIDFADCKTAAPLGRGGDRVCFEAPSCYDLLLGGKKVVGASQRRKNGLILHQSTVFMKGDREELISQMLEGFREKWDVTFEEGPLTEKELKKAREKEKERYGSAEWAFLL
ncbi:MAG: lipoate--protein ligase family protein [Candidatus Omnitrophota bacterium]